MIREVALVSALHGLDRAEALLALGAKHDRLAARLAPDMWAFRTQIAVSVGFARRAVLPLTGAVPERLDEDHTEEGLRAAIAQARTVITSAEGDCPTGIGHIAGEAALEQTPLEYTAQFALPNLWFHLSMAYAILRTEGAPVGKADFDGLHAYSGAAGEA